LHQVMPCHHLAWAMTRQRARPSVTMVEEVDRSSDMPPYMQVAKQLRDAILSGQYEPRSRLPSIDRICQETGVARFTARKAVRVLAGEGLARVVEGWGAFVTEQEQWPQ
jgi:DNA-binding GntR family transcriptional regulator